ncbi:MAG: sensor histidine kinase N-terminal domain-containing protein [Rhodocyclaceae bacterium]|nr:sensor histidine kinase N-terminal domain-containing protein [Rhodocyclaceae bacterium]
MSLGGRILRWPSSLTSLFAGANVEHEPNSLFLEILDWMLAPLLLLWPISIALTNHYAHQIADQPYDAALIETVQVVSRIVESATWPMPNQLPHATQLMLTGNGVDSRFFRISSAPQKDKNSLAPQSSEFVAESSTTTLTDRTTSAIPLAFDIGTAEIPITYELSASPSKNVLMRDDTVGGEAVRIAYRAVRVGAQRDGQIIVIQVAETRNEREALVSRIIRGVLLPQFALIPLVAILSYLGLTRGLQPLRRLRERIVGRRPGDLSPLAADQAPEEVRPLLLSLNEMMRRLEVNLEAQQRFIADAAHQLRTPLTGLKMQADLAADEHDPVRLQKSMRLIAQSTDRAAHLTKQLLTLARTESSHDKLHRVEPCDLRALARAVTIEWAERAMAKEIDLAFECGEWPHMTEGVPLLLRELLSNLIDNAVKYTPRGGRVTVRLRAMEFFILEVEDTGAGIPPAERSKVFERFYRILGNAESGSGLGLPIVQEIADRHRASVELHEGNAGGCLFRVSFVRRGGASAPLDLRPN